MSDRELVLGRIRSALADVPAGEPSAWSWADDPDPGAAYRRGGTDEDPSALAERFLDRCGDYSATVSRCEEASLVAALAAVCERHGVDRLVVAPGFDARRIPPGVTVQGDDPPLSVERLDASHAVLTGCAVAIADTGTIVLDAGPGQGRRALSLVPDLHVVVVDVDRIVSGVPEGIEALASAVAQRRPLTLISGPSATSDIELTRVEGVHGPRRLEVLVVAPSAHDPYLAAGEQA
ncbi:MAG TPA: LUD domain-containing protein [Solirubrobacteraceae bacterium]|nr:LUD domain-containing protein [Solirubrobacteraceae bacterium]